MKKGPILAVTSAAVLTLLLVIAPRTPEETKEKKEQVVHNHSSEGMDPLDAKVAEAIEIVQRQEQSPMVAIGILREVIEENPKHIGALMTLGDLSMMSNQLDRAEGRYLTILAIEPGQFEALEKLLQVYESTGNVEGAIEAIEEFLEKNQGNPNVEALNGRLSQLRGK